MNENTILWVDLGHIKPGLNVMVKPYAGGKWQAVIGFGIETVYRTQSIAPTPLAALTVALAKVAQEEFKVKAVTEVKQCQH